MSTTDTAVDDAGQAVNAIAFRIDPSTLDHIDRARLAIKSPLAREIALAILWRTRTFLKTGVYRDGSRVHVMRVFIEQTLRDRQQIVAFIEAEMVAVVHDGRAPDYYTLLWHPQAEDFLVRYAPPV